jgi:DNA-binding NtrC family response regulator
MPLLDGVALAERAFPLQPGLRVLLMSGFADQLERAKDITGPHVAVLSKPFTLDQVRASVKKLLG